MQFCACFSKNPKRRAAHHQDTANKLPPDFARIGSTPYNPNRKEQWPQTPIRNTAN
jgi:GMP synthase-like glutamine amidotransferase